MQRRGERLPKPDYDIGPVLENYGMTLPYRRGGWQSVKCPFHDDSRASASVSFDLNRFICWVGCTTRAEDTVGLLQYVEGLTFQAAVEEASRITGSSHVRVQRVVDPGSALLTESWD
jgi:DNA primase